MACLPDGSGVDESRKSSPGGISDRQRDQITLPSPSPREMKEAVEVRHFPANRKLQIDVLQKQQPLLQIEYDTGTVFPDNSDFILTQSILKSSCTANGKTFCRNKSLNIPHGGLWAAIKPLLSSGLAPN